ncbi:AAA family ATPase [[Clostridium] polysaccharolyticum]|uniref:CobQ/CobB/MinD/ParA nucleotide binding domain-containing protein n=1 Tax=[Clostridium] polysaccharolyticum TaxID=29364 RepID=A0A1H9Y9Y2_9FIRM|nr:AAA family ATPase [[Clostridium] polysaccharolyticum]SES65236.1 CobQ/CobB/MinD/ParA nucleotide binding domain-containing protein [[Clostridium] polysaccharolyticum]
MSSKNGKLVAVWGSSGAGKTTFAINLALALAKKQLESLVILTDINAPDLKVLLPFEKDLKSMGYLWTRQDADKTDIYNACVVTKSEYICLMGYTKGENAFSYSDYTKDNVFRIYEEMRTMADYVIVDCVPNLAYNMLTTVALETADCVVRMGEAKKKSFSFFDSSLPLLADSRYEREKHIRLLSKVKSDMPIEIAKKYLGCDLELPYIEEAQKQMMEGMLLSGIKDPCYVAVIKEIAERIEKEES